MPRETDADCEIKRSISSALLPSLERIASISAIRRSCSAMIFSLPSWVTLNNCVSSRRVICSNFLALSATSLVSLPTEDGSGVGALVLGGPSRKAILAWIWSRARGQLIDPILQYADLGCVDDGGEAKRG